MKDIKRIQIGSSVFFSEYDDYQSKDIDVLSIMDEFFPGSNSMRLKFNNTNEDVFLYRNLDKEGFIKDDLKSGLPMRAGKYLVPEFIEYIGLTLEDLKQFKSMFENMDEKHRYEKIIYDSYIENNGFFLTDVQRNIAYYEYKKPRQYHK